jgi:hypothetical protein
MRKAEAERELRAVRERAEAEAAARAAWGAHIYDPVPYREARPDVKTYDGTGIGVLYGLSGSARFAIELGDWRVVPRSHRP